MTTQETLTETQPPDTLLQSLDQAVLKAYENGHLKLGPEELAGLLYRTGAENAGRLAMTNAIGNGA